MGEYRLEDDPSCSKSWRLFVRSNHIRINTATGAGRIKLALELLHAAAESVADMADGLIVNDKLIVAIHSKRWRVDGRWKWYWYANVTDLLRDTRTNKKILGGATNVEANFAKSTSRPCRKT